MRNLELIGVTGIPLIETGNDLAGIIIEALRQNAIQLHTGDVVVVTSKIISKSEGRWVNLNEVTPDEIAKKIAAKCGKDPREVAVIMSEATAVSRIRQGVLIVRHKLGFVCANAGVDHSNTRPGSDWRLLLPENPDRAARMFRQRLTEAFDVPLAVIITDSHGRPFRLGTIGAAIGSAGLPALWDLRGHPDLFGVALRVTDVGFADEISAAAGLVLGQANEATPVVIVRGLIYPADDVQSAQNLIRPAELDLYQ